VDSETKYHHGNLKQALIDNALDLIKGQGVEKLSLRKLAATIGVNQTALYSHFKNKNELLAELARQGYSALALRMKRLEEQNLKHDAVLMALSRSYIEFAQENPEIFKLMFSPSFSELHKNDPELWTTSEQSFHIYERIIQNYLQQKGSELQPKLAALAVWSFMHGFCHLVIGDRLSDETLHALNEGVLLNGLLNIFENGLGN